MSISSKRTTRNGFLSIVGLIIFVAILGRANYRFAVQNPGGNDFLVHWLGTRSFITEGISPYSDEVALRIQMLVYGHPAQGGEHELRVVYPFYSQLIFAPFALIADYTLARTVWMTFSEIVIVFTAGLSMRLTRWQPNRWLLPIFLIFSLLWYHGLRAVINGNAVVVVTLLVVAALMAIREKRDMLAGILLALATVKPHLVVFPIVFIFIWAVSQKRRGLIGWTCASVAALAILGMAFLPNWMLQNILEILKFPNYNPALTFGEAFQEWWPGIGTQLKWGLAIFLSAVLIIEWWSAWGKGFPHFLWTLCLTLTVSQWIGIATDPGNFILLFLPMVLIFSVWRERWGKGGDWIVLTVLVVLFVGLWAIFLNTVEYGNQPIQHPIMFLPMPLFTLLGLYWIRWWVLRPTRHILDSSNPLT
jgi:hypothetical protein